MKHRNLRRSGIALVFIALLFTIGFSKPGRSALNGLISLVTVSRENRKADTTPSGASTSIAGDVETRARANHGWNANIMNAVSRGTVTYYDIDGKVTGQSEITLYRKYPQLLRIEIVRNGTREVLGFDQVQAWKSGAKQITEEDARDIRAFLRVSPERLFVTRSEGAQYREAGVRVEDSAPADDGTVSSVILEQVQMEDTVGPSPSAGWAGDRRNVYYYIDRDSSTVVTARWLEPDDPRRSVRDPNISLTDVRVDFGGWQRVDDVLWPFEISHQMGGRVDYRIQLKRVRVNQSLEDSLFQP